MIVPMIFLGVAIVSGILLIVLDIQEAEFQRKYGREIMEIHNRTRRV